MQKTLQKYQIWLLLWLNLVFGFIIFWWNPLGFYCDSHIYAWDYNRGKKNRTRRGQAHSQYLILRQIFAADCEKPMIKVTPWFKAWHTQIKPISTKIWDSDNSVRFLIFIITIQNSIIQYSCNIVDSFILCFDVSIC